MSTPKYSTVLLNEGTKVFYREAGDPLKPKLLLLHGFPSSSRQYKDLILLLKDHFHIVAPDLPGYGATSVTEKYQFTFDNLANTIDAFLDAIKFTTFALYIFDYGAPVGFRIALKPTKKVTALITQNGNAYEEGFGDVFWPGLHPAWKLADEGKLSDKSSAAYQEATKPLKGALRDLVTYSSQYVNGEPDQLLVDPELGLIDYQLLINKPNAIQQQLDLMIDYRNNIPLYPKFQDYLKKSKIPILAIWGKHDPIFAYAGAEAFKRDNPETTKLVPIDAGHFALSSHPAIVAKEIIEFLK